MKQTLESSPNSPPSSLLLSRQDWVNACHFHDLTEYDVLKKVAHNVSETRSHASAFKTPHPLVLLDLDATLYEVAPRTLAIIQEWLSLNETEKLLPAAVFEKLKGVRIEHVGYSLRDLFNAVGLDTYTQKEATEAWDIAKKFWAKRFFTNEYLKHDLPFDGAAHFVQELYRLGAEIVYLTGRDEPQMGEGTRKRLIDDGFPFGIEKTHLILKPHISQDDLEYKKNAAETVRHKGKLIASFENEPPNLVALYQSFPQAMHVFVESSCSEREAPVVQGLYRIKGYPHVASI